MTRLAAPPPCPFAVLLAFRQSFIVLRFLIFVGSYLSSREQACLDNCARRFLETTQFVVKYFQSKAGASSGGDSFH